MYWPSFRLPGTHIFDFSSSILLILATLVHFSHITILLELSSFFLHILVIFCHICTIYTLYSGDSLPRYLSLWLAKSFFPANPQKPLNLAILHFPPPHFIAPEVLRIQFPHLGSNILSSLGWYQLRWLFWGTDLLDDHIPAIIANMWPFPLHPTI